MLKLKGADRQRQWYNRLAKALKTKSMARAGILNSAGLKPEPGQALLLVIGGLLIGTLLLGLVVEVGHLYITQRTLQNDADSAAAYGAMQVDVTGLRLSDGDKVENASTGGVFDPTTAGQQVASYLSGLGYGSGDYTWDWRRCQLKVTLKRSVPTVFVSIFGIQHTTVQVSGQAVIFDNPNGCD